MIKSPLIILTFIVRHMTVHFKPYLNLLISQLLFCPILDSVNLGGLNVAVYPLMRICNLDFGKIWDFSTHYIICLNQYLEISYPVLIL